MLCFQQVCKWLLPIILLFFGIEEKGEKSVFAPLLEIAAF